MTTSENSVPNPPHFLDAHAVVRPNKVALICGEHSLTYAEFNARARRVANALAGLGVKTNDRVAVMAHNSIELLEITAGLSKLSALSVLLNYRLREHDVAYIAIGDELPAGWLRYEDLLAAAGEGLPSSESRLGSSMSYTSGTTGKPKGAYRPRGLQVNEIIQAILAFELAESDVHLLAGPYYHSAPSAFTSLHAILGSTIVIQPKYDPVEALELIDRHKVTTTFMAPTLLQRLVDVPAEVFSRYDVSSLRSIILGG